MNNRYEKHPLKSPDRPIQVLDSVDAGVPEPSRRFLNHVVDRVRFPNGNEGYHHRISVPEGIMLAHVDPTDYSVALVDNYRHPIGRYSRELPSGGLELDEAKRFEAASPEERERILKLAAIREFREEIGARLDEEDVTRLLPGPLQGSVGFADQTYHIFHGEGGESTHQSLDDGEAGMLTHDRYSIGDANEMIGYEVVDPATATALSALALEYGIRVSRGLRRLSQSSEQR